MESRQKQVPVQAWIYLASAALSMLGNAVATVVWPWMVLRATGDASAAGVVAAAIAIPSLLFAVIGGNLIDKYGRKPLSIISDVISGLSIVALIITGWMGWLDMTALIVIGIIGAVGDIPGMAARSALVGDVSRVSGYTIEKIAGINQAIMGISFLVGPAVAGGLMAALELEQVLWITAACSLLAAFVTSLLRLNNVPEEEKTEQEQQLEDEALAQAGILGADEDDPYKGLAGWKLVLSYPLIRLLALMTIAPALTVGPYLMILLPAHFESQDNPVMLGASMSGYAIGMMVAGLFAQKFAGKHRLAWFTAMSLYALGFACMGVLSIEWVVLLGMIIAGLGGGVFAPLQMVLVTESTDDAVRGRAFSVFTAISQTVAPVGLLVVAAILQYYDIYTVAYVIAAFYIAVSIVGTLWGARVLSNLSTQQRA